MARTVKTEYSGPDGWHICARLERQARPAGRLARTLADALDELADMDDAYRYRLAPAS